MTEAEGLERDLAALVVARVGCLEETGSPWEPYRLVGPDGQAVGAVGEYLKELQAAGRSQATQRSYGVLCRTRHKWPYADALVMPCLC